MPPLDCWMRRHTWCAKAQARQDVQAEIPPLAQKEIALLAGLARETALRMLSKLRTRGTVAEDNGRLRIVDSQPLVKRGLLPV